MAVAEMERVALIEPDGVFYKGPAIVPLLVDIALKVPGLVDNKPAEFLEFRELWKRYEGKVDTPDLLEEVLPLAGSILEGLPVTTAEEIAKEFFGNAAFPWCGDVKAFMAKLQEHKDGHNVETILISSEPLFVLEALSFVLGMEDGPKHKSCYGTRFGVNHDDGTFDGTIPLLFGPKSKQALAERILSTRGRKGSLPKKYEGSKETAAERRGKVHDPNLRSCAIGHDERDTGMLETVLKPVGVLPDDGLRTLPGLLVVKFVSELDVRRLLTIPDTQ